MISVDARLVESSAAEEKKSRLLESNLIHSKATLPNDQQPNPNYAIKTCCKYS